MAKLMADMRTRRATASASLLARPAAAAALTVYSDMNAITVLMASV